MRKVLLLAVLLIACCASSVSATQKIHVVEKGECLSLIGTNYGVQWRKIQVASGLKTTIIFPGQKLVIPVEKSRKAISSKAENYKLNIWKKVNANPYKGTAEWAIHNFDLPENIKAQVLENISAGKYQWGKEIYSGQMISEVTFGKNKIWSNVLTLWDKTKTYANKDYGVGEYNVVYVLKCGNWAWWKKEEVPPSVPVIPVPIPELPPEQTEIPSILKVTTEVKKCHLLNNQLDGGGGHWWAGNGYSSGDWWYAQYLITYIGCGKGSFDVFGGTLTPEFGVYAKGDRGETKANFDWVSWGFGPKVGFTLNSRTDSGLPQQVQFLAGPLWERLRGENNTSGYSKSEKHLLLGYYGEYIRRLASDPSLMAVFYTHGWVDLDDSIRSTWDGDSASDRSSFTVGAKIHKDFNPDWAGRVGVEAGYMPQDRVWVLGANAEARYRNWLMFGPNFNYVLSSAVEGAANTWSGGPFLRVELQKKFERAFTNYRYEQVSQADNVLEY